MAYEKTLVLIKPDGVQRGIIGQVITKFENAGLKIVAMKLKRIDKEFAKKHYTDDIAKRNGEKVRAMLLDFITSSPVVAMCIEGVEAVDVVRKLVGPTEPSKAPPGTIRGDFAHITLKHADEKGISTKNIVHASGNKKEAEYEVALWFTKEEIMNYTKDCDANTL